MKMLKVGEELEEEEEEEKQNKTEQGITATREANENTCSL